MHRQATDVDGLREYGGSGRGQVAASYGLRGAVGVVYAGGHVGERPEHMDLGFCACYGPAPCDHQGAIGALRRNELIKSDAASCAKTGLSASSRTREVG